MTNSENIKPKEDSSTIVSYVPKSLRKLVDERVKKLNRSISEYIRLLIEQDLKKFLLLAILILTAQSAYADKLVCFGDSVTQGYGVAEADKWCTKLRGINAGVGGNNTISALRRFSRDVLRRNPDVVTIGFGIGDARYSVPYETYKKNLTFMVKALKRRGARVILLTPNLTVHVWLNDLMLPYAQIVRQLARKESVPLVDNTREYAEIIQGGGFMFDMTMDGVHPNVIGSDIIYRGVKRRL